MRGPDQGSPTNYSNSNFERSSIYCWVLRLTAASFSIFVSFSVGYPLFFNSFLYPCWFRGSNLHRNCLSRIHGLDQILEWWKHTVLDFYVQAHSMLNCFWECGPILSTKGSRIVSWLNIVITLCYFFSSDYKLNNYNESSDYSSLPTD